VEKLLHLEDMPVQCLGEVGEVQVVSFFNVLIDCRWAKFKPFNWLNFLVVCNNFAFITSFLFDTDSENENEEFDRSDQPRRRPARLKVRKNEKGETQLHLSCISGNLALVKKLIEQVGHTESGNFVFTWSDN
jgi:hypothetical protein